MNLLIALMGGSYERVEERSSYEGLKKKAELIVGFEELMSSVDVGDRKPNVIRKPDSTMFPDWLHFFQQQEADGGDADLDDGHGVINGVKRLLDQQQKILEERVNLISANAHSAIARVQAQLDSQSVALRAIETQQVRTTTLHCNVATLQPAFDLPSQASIEFHRGLALGGCNR